uniref:Peptidase S1 domain-containing protein n=1 Tax=Strongyloides papillosus TaxID=174720 RepID=A0A0N5C7B4_STREA
MVKFPFLLLLIYRYFLINGIHYGKIISRSLPDSTVIIVIRKNNDEVGYCGGNLLSNKLVVTAAHCVNEIKNSKQINIMKGYKDFPLSINKQDIKRKIKILWIEIHPSYQKYSLSASYDVALIGIDGFDDCCSEDLESSSIAVLPFNLNDGKNIINKHFISCFIIGRGKTEKGFLANQLRGIIYKKPLLYKYKNITNFIGYYENLTLESGKFDEGDSGNGLYCNSNNQTYLIGIASSCFYTNMKEKIIDINTFAITFSENIKLFLLNVIKRKNFIDNITILGEKCIRNNKSMGEIYNHMLT